MEIKMGKGWRLNKNRRFSPRVTLLEENIRNENVGSKAKLQLQFLLCLIQHTSFHAEG